MSNLARFLSPYIETIELDNIIGAVVENRLKQGLRLWIGHSKYVEILCEKHTFDFSNWCEVSAISDVSFGYNYHFTHGEDELSSPEYDTLLILEDNGLDDVVLAHYKLKDNDLESLVGYFRI